MTLIHSPLSANDFMTEHIMLHSAIGDSVVAFRDIIKFSEENRKKDINLVYNKNIDPFIQHWVWPDNITLMPLEQTTQDVDNTCPFPYTGDEHNISEAFHKNEDNAHDFRPFFIQRDHEPLEHNLKDFIPDQPPFLHGLGKYIVIQPLSTINHEHSPKYIDEELETYEKFLINLIEHIHMYSPFSVVTVGNQEDGTKFPHLMAMGSHGRYFNLIGYLGIEDLCTVIGYSSGVFGLSSSAIKIGNSVFEKPVISWRLTSPWSDLFDNFLENDSQAIHRPWEQEMTFYSDFIKNNITNAQQPNINS